jgi:hypothetical protein
MPGKIEKLKFSYYILAVAIYAWSKSRRRVDWFSQLEC